MDGDETNSSSSAAAVFLPRKDDNDDRETNVNVGNSNVSDDVSSKSSSQEAKNHTRKTRRPLPKQSLSSSSSSASKQQELSSIPEDEQKRFSSTNSNTDNDNDDNDDNDEDVDEDVDVDGTSPLWSGSNAGWNLTWPIWHMLPHHERKSLAKQYGYKSIGEFEEYMSLQQAMGDSTTTTTTTTTTNTVSTSTTSTTSRPSIGSMLSNHPQQKQQQQQTGSRTELSSSSSSPSLQKEYANEQAYLHLKGGDDDYNTKKKPPTVKTNDNNEDEDDDDNQSTASSASSTTQSEQDEQEAETTTTTTNDIDGTGLSIEELMELGGQILVLPSELLHRVFSYLPVDTYGVLALVSPHWKHLTRTEHVYRKLCERLYLNQSKRRQLHVHKFGGSYRTMLEVRPRVRAAGGCYVLKYAQIKKVQRDMWTEVPVGAILESIYYRYFYFQEDGRVLYALTSAPPHEMFRRLIKLVLHKDATDAAAVWGDFVVQKHNCTVIAKQQHTSVRFDLTIQHQSSFGRFAALTLDRHYSSQSQNFEDWSDDRVEYKVPSELFRFVRDPRL